MLFCSLIINPRRTHYPLFVAVFAAVSDSFFKSKYSITIAAAVVSIQPTGCQELSRPLHDLWSQDPELSANHAHVRFVVFSAIALKEMTNPKAALESKATMAAASIRLTGGH